jgi:hypothetical protein
MTHKKSHLELYRIMQNINALPRFKTLYLCPSQTFPLLSSPHVIYYLTTVQAFLSECG